MSLPRYPEYKESGVEWLGRVPTHWEVKRLKHNLRLLTEKTDRRTNPIALENIESWSGRFVPTETEFQGDGVAFERDDILFGKLRPYLAKVLLAPECGEAVGDFHVMRPSSAIYPRFAQFSMLNRSFINIVDGSTFGSKMPRASWDFVSSIEMATPTLAEQTAIATFLDRETVKIDALIAEQEKLLALLAEKRQATISHAVTKGLNPDAPRKDSGVAWLGEVPRHWKLGQLKNFICQKSGAIKTGPFGSHLTSAEMQQGEIKVYNQRSVIDNNFVDGENYISQEKFEQLSSFQTFPGDVLVTTRGTIGRAAILPESADIGILHPCLLRVQVDETKLQRKFLVALIQDSHLMKTQIALNSNATTIEVIYSETMASLFIPLPPVEEQGEILNFLDTETARLDALAAEATRAIALLKERRSALISAAVTGQIDVRGLVTQPEAA